MARSPRLLALLRVGAFLRRALAVRSAGAVQVSIRGASVRRRDSFVDSQVGRLLSYLDAHDLMRNTVIVVMGDHGESLGEHGEGTHGFFVYQATMHVPLLIRAPYDVTAGRRVSDTVRSVDILDRKSVV